MCGIAGNWTDLSQPGVNGVDGHAPRLVDAMLDRLAHRGPGAFGTLRIDVTDGDEGRLAWRGRFGHRRLSIDDLHGGTNRCPATTPRSSPTARCTTPSRTEPQLCVTDPGASRRNR